MHTYLVYGYCGTEGMYFRVTLAPFLSATAMLSIGACLEPNPEFMGRVSSHGSTQTNIENNCSNDTECGETQDLSEDTWPDSSSEASDSTTSTWGIESTTESQETGVPTTDTSTTDGDTSESGASTGSTNTSDTTDTDSDTSTGDSMSDTTDTSTSSETTESDTSSDTDTTSDTDSTEDICVPELCFTLNAGENVDTGYSCIESKQAIEIVFTNQSRRITRMEIVTGRRTGTNRLAIYSDNGNYPGSERTGKNWSMSSTISWQGVELDTPIEVAQNEQFWLVWSALDTSQASIAFSGTTVRVPFQPTGSSTWDVQQRRFMARIYCCE